VVEAGGLQHFHPKIVQAVRRRAANRCAAHGGHGQVEWGGGFAFFARFEDLDGQGTAKDVKDAKI
jgi:hypothetical protein